MEQNVIAIIWDFDKTLVDGYMQKPIFKKYDINEQKFWFEVNNLATEYLKQGIRVNKDTIYLNHFITCVGQGIFPGLNNSLLKELGKELEFYNGIPDIFDDLKSIVENNENYKKFSIQVEHYIVSTGLTEMIRGSKINEFVKDIWGCEFIEKPIKSTLRIKGHVPKESVGSEDTQISQIAYAIDNTSKTRAVFEINKGSNLFPNIDVNSKIEYKDRRVPFENMIYVADGPSDVPVFSLLKNNGGKTYAIYPKGDSKAFRQVNMLIKDGRIDMFGEADYSKDTTTYLWLREQVEEIANNIYTKKIQQIDSSVSRAPQHIID